MRLESKKYLYDIARAAAAAKQFVSGKNFSDYTADAMLRSAVDHRIVWNVLEAKLPVVRGEAEALLGGEK